MECGHAIGHCAKALFLSSEPDTVITTQKLLKTHTSPKYIYLAVSFIHQIPF